MMRASSFLQRFPVLLLAAMLVALAVFFAPGGQPAQAQTASVYSATLTVADTGGSDRGCYETLTGSAKCSQALSSNTFSHEGENYQVHQIDVQATSVWFRIGGAATPANVKSMILWLDGRAFPLSEGVIYNFRPVVVSWTISDRPSWNVGQTVAVQISDPYLVSLSTSTSTVREGESVEVTATLSKTRTSDTVVPVTLYAGSAEDGDYGTLESITIPAGATTGTGTITTTMDSDTDDEMFFVGLSNVAKDAEYAWGAVSWLDITIWDNDLRQVSLSVSPNPVDEAQIAVVTATLTSLRWGEPASLGSDVTIPLTFTAGSAESDDYTDFPSVTIPAGSTTNAASGFIITSDDTDADDETFTVALDTANSAWPSGVRPGPITSVQVRISDDDAASPGTLSVDTGFGNPECGSAVSFTSVKPEWALVLSPAPAAEEQTEYRVLADVNGRWLSTVPVFTTGSSVFTSTNTFGGLRAAYPGFTGFEFRLADHASVTASCTWKSPTGGVAVGATQEASLAGVFDYSEGDTPTITAASSNDAIATVSVAADHSALTVTGVAEGAATITVTTEDPQGEEASDAFQVEVVGRYADLIARMKEWRNDPQWVSEKAHTDRWDRALLAFGETVADTTLTPMTAAEAQGFADRGWERWVEVAAALRQLENQDPTVSSALSDVTIVNESGSHEVSLAGVFDDADGDALTVSAASGDEATATASVASGGSSLTVTARLWGTAVVTVTADDGNGGTVSETFTVTVKAAPTVSAAIADVSGLEAGSTQEVLLSGAFSDADGNALTITAASSDETRATVSVASGGARLTLAGVAEGTATITATAEDTDGNRVSDAFQVEVVAPPPPATPNQAPTVSSAIADATIVNESGASQVSLSGVFSDGDNDALTITAASSDGAVATVSVAADHSTLTVSAQARGTATITATANDGNGGTVEDAFTVTVKAAPTVSTVIAHVSGLEAGDTRDVSLAGVFSDADGDRLTITAASSDAAIATVSVASDGPKLTIAGVSEGTATITVTARDSDGNRVSDDFDVSVESEPEQDPPPDGDTPNQAPTVAQPLPDVSLKELQWRQFSLPGVFRDPDGDELTFTEESSDYGVASVWVSGSTLTVVAKSTGTATITVTAEDSDGNRVGDAFEVTVRPAS